MSSKRKVDLGIQQPQEPADTCFFHWDRTPPADRWAADRNRDWRRSSTPRGPDPSRLPGGSWHFQVVRWCSGFGYRPADQRFRCPVLSSPGLPMPGMTCWVVYCSGATVKLVWHISWPSNIPATDSMACFWKSRLESNCIFILQAPYIDNASLFEYRNRIGFDHVIFEPCVLEYHAHDFRFEFVFQLGNAFDHFERDGIR